MKKREFNKILKELSGKDKILSPEKIALLSNEKKNEMINFVVRNRLPIVLNFLNNATDIKWLHAMGYLELKKGKNFTFLCTSENKLQIK